MSDLISLDETDYYEAFREEYKHRLIFDLLYDANFAKIALEEDHGFDRVDVDFDSDSNNYEVTFSTDYKLTGEEQTDILSATDCYNYQFNREDY